LAAAARLAKAGVVAYLKGDRHLAGQSGRIAFAGRWAHVLTLSKHRIRRAQAAACVRR
jgi:hypothetical protein